MDAHQYLARRDMGSRPEGSTPPRGSEPRSGCIIPRLGQGTCRDRTPSPARRAPRVDTLVPRRAPGSLRSPEPPGHAGAEPPAPPQQGAAPARRIDPRWYQIAMLSALLGYGVFGLGFDL